MIAFLRSGIHFQSLPTHPNRKREHYFLKLDDQSSIPMNDDELKALQRLRQQSWDVRQRSQEIHERSQGIDERNRALHQRNQTMRQRVMAI